MKELIIAGLEACHARILEIPQTHSAEKEDYVRTNAPSLYPDSVSIDRLEFVLFDSMALIYRPSRCVSGGRPSGYQLLPPAVYALCRGGMHPGVYDISDGRYRERFHFDGHNIRQHSFSIREEDPSPTLSSGTAGSVPEHGISSDSREHGFRLKLILKSGRQGMTEDSFQIISPEADASLGRELDRESPGRLAESMEEVVSDFYAGHIHNRGFYTRSGKGGVRPFLWAPVAMLLGFLILTPLYFQTRDMRRELESSREQFLELQRSVQTGNSTASGKKLPELETLLLEHPPLKVFENIYILTDHGYPNIQIQSISSSGTEVQFTIRGEYPLELQEALVNDPRVEKARISRITANPDGSRNFVLVLTQASEGGSP